LDSNKNVCKTYVEALFRKKLQLFKIKKNSRFPLFYVGLRVYLPQHCLYFLPLPHGPLYPGFWELLGALGALIQHLVALGSTP